MSGRCRRSAMTLVETLVVISIIGMLMSLLLPAVQASRESARRTQCQNNLHQLSLALAGFESSRGRFPPGRFGGNFGYGPTSRAWSWGAELLPLLERKDLYDLGSVQTAALNASIATSQQLSIFLCPSAAVSGPRVDAGNLAGLPVGQATYKAVSGANWGDDYTQPGNVQIATDWRNKGRNGSYDGLDDGDGIMFRSDYQNPSLMARIRDGTSRTFLLGEDLPDQDEWVSWPYANNAYGTCAMPPNLTKYPPANWENTWGFRSRHPGGLNFAMCDGSVRWINDSIALAVYRALATIDGQEVFGDDQWR
ncbi:MAG TPA: DUF1559 domain-containing protein [Pirellulales bacterium]|nr:DUF1559 domain-containing protein [Pirellulales bacterium]